MNKDNQKLSPSHIGILLGVFYGLFTRVLWSINSFNNFWQLVTLSFMFAMPSVIGFIRVYFELKIHPNLTYKKMSVIAWQPIFIFLPVTFVTLLEGSICIIMALPGFLLFSSIGGLLAGWFHYRFKKSTPGTLLSVSILPFLLSPLELSLGRSPVIYEVSNSIEIQASASEVWNQITTVNSIHEDELPLSITHLIGVPKPIKADMNASGVGAIRVSHWEKNVIFKEVITQWVPNQSMQYSFDIDPNKIPDQALDQHVKLGGEFFSPMYGGYDIKKTKHGVVLSLKTTLRDNTNFGLYSRYWGELIFQDFHNTLLELIKNRAEENKGNSI
jgi:hypothetical protein